MFHKVASKLEVFPGAEFRVAYEEAKKYGGRVILGDRSVQVSFFMLEVLSNMLPVIGQLLVPLLFELLF